MQDVSINNVTIEVIGPREAGEYLQHNTHNRNPKRGRIQRYAKDMLEGRWEWTGEPITFAPDGTLLDGQNRLMAVQRADVSVSFLVVRNVSQGAQDVMDTGAPRTFSDALRLRGESNATQLAATVRLLDLWERGPETFRVGHVNPGASIPMLLNTLETHSDVREFLRAGGVTAYSTGLTSTAATFSHYTLSRIDDDDAEYFFERLRDGVGLDADSPIRQLREVLNRMKMERHGRGGTGGKYYVQMVALTFKAWNKYRAGESTVSLRWRPGGSKPEDFPVPR